MTMMSPLVPTATPPDYFAGNVVQCQASFVTVNGQYIDPTVVEFLYISPGGAEQTLIYGTDAAVLRISQGVYMVPLDTTGTPGLWQWAFFSSGAGQAYNFSSFNVIPAPL